MSAKEAWNYISQHQDDSKYAIAEALNIPIEKAVSLIFDWALGDISKFTITFDTP